MKNCSAFTLIELAVVLVIVGLIVAGVIQGQELIKQAQLRNIISEKESFDLARNTFFAKYNAIPGDMKNAVKYWGALGGSNDDGYNPDCEGASYDISNHSGNLTCNGNGTGIYDSNFEILLFWEHLSNSQLISGNYNSVYGDNGSGRGFVTLGGFNVPKSKFRNATWGVLDSLIGYLPADKNGYYCFGTPVDESACGISPALTAEETYSLDLKYDDGKPQGGRILADTFWTNNCFDSINNSYNLTNKEIACGLFFAPQL
jgi:prepilin-type N-terminal cleavage/methylation domain-containing protein